MAKLTDGDLKLLSLNDIRMLAQALADVVNDHYAPRQHPPKYTDHWERATRFVVGLHLETEDTSFQWARQAADRMRQGKKF